VKPKEGVRKAYISPEPAGRLGTPRHLAEAMRYFASEEADFITGQCLVVDGGRELAG